MRVLRLFATLAVTSAVAAGCGAGGGASSNTIRVGWQTPWATQGQIVQVLKRTNALELNGMHATYAGFAYGAPLNAAALSGAVDVIFTADQPAAALVARGGRWTIVGRLMYNRVSVYVPPRSSITTVAGLKGKRIGMPFGAAAQREALRAIEGAGLNIDHDIKPVNLDMSQQVPIVRRGSAASWSGVDALAGFDPVPAELQAEGKVRMLHTSNVVSVVMMSNRVLEQHRDAAVRFLTAFRMAYYYFARHPKQTGGWFVKDSDLPFSQKALDISASVEPNASALRPEDVRILLNQAEIQQMRDGITFLHDHGLIDKAIDIRRFIDQGPASAADARLQSDPQLFNRVAPTG